MQITFILNLHSFQHFEMGSVFNFYQVTHHESVLAIMTAFGHVSSCRKDWKSGFGPRMLFLCQRQWGGNPRETGQSARRLYQLLRYFLERNGIDGISTKSTLFIVVWVHLRLLQINKNSKVVLTWELLQVNKNSKVVVTWALLQVNRNSKVVLTRRDQPSISHELVWV